MHRIRIEKAYNKELFKKEGYRKILWESVQSSETGLVGADLIAFDFFCITREKDQKSIIQSKSSVSRISLILLRINSFKNSETNI